MLFITGLKFDKDNMEALPFNERGAAIFSFILSLLILSYMSKD